MDGWIKLYRRLLDWQWVSSPNHLVVFTHLLLRANFRETKWREEVILPGQLLTGRKQLSQWTGLTERQVRTVLRDLKTTKEIDTKTTKQYSIISITNWESHQGDDHHATITRPHPKKAKKYKNNTYTSDSGSEAKKILSDATPQEKLKTELFATDSIHPLEEVRTSDLARNVLTALNSICFRSFRPVGSNMKFVNARIKEGYTYEDFVKVFKYKQAEWDGTDFSRFLQPSTLLSGKFDQYLQQANNNDAPMAEKDQIQAARELYKRQFGVYPEVDQGVGA